MKGHPLTEAEKEHLGEHVPEILQEMVVSRDKETLTFEQLEGIQTQTRGHLLKAFRKEFRRKGLTSEDREALRNKLKEVKIDLKEVEDVQPKGYFSSVSNWTPWMTK